MKPSGSGTMVWLVFFLLMLSPIFALAEKSEKWPGIDESVVEKIAKEQGREAREPIINTDQGDLLLFVFLLAGAVGGFAAGYYWRRLITEKAPLANRTADLGGTEGLKGPRGDLH
jgi:ABC-type cobalt transport system substrate-binding protein